jgi:hypothetical protein
VLVVAYARADAPRPASEGSRLPSETTRKRAILDVGWSLRSERWRRSTARDVRAIPVDLTAVADKSNTRGKDKLTGTVSGVAIHPIFGLLPFTDSTDGQSDGVKTKGGGTISLDFSGPGFGVITLQYKYTCLTARDNISIERWRVTASSNQVVVPVGAAGLSSVVDGKGSGLPDTSRSRIPAPPTAPGVTPCSFEDGTLLDDDTATSALTVTSGNWTVHDGLPGSP